MNLTDRQLLQELQTIQWGIAARIYGNNHASLIGLFTSWWIAKSPQTHWALESGPSFGYHQKGLGGGMCDALLCEGHQALGVLEVEGTRGKYTAEKIGSFFGADLEHYRSLAFGILALYAYSPVGRGSARSYRPAQDIETIQAVKQVSSNYPEKLIAVVTLDKVYHRQQTGLRARSDFYAGELSKVTGFLFKNGQEIATRVLYGEMSAG